jgi:starch-binding outer membrane protein, SusD/RagB family
LRIARRMNKEGRNGTQFFNDAINKKYQKSGIPAPDFSSEDKWYLPANFK